jgi:hypothetical protein
VCRREVEKDRLEFQGCGNNGPLGFQAHLLVLFVLRTVALGDIRGFDWLVQNGFVDHRTTGGRAGFTGNVTGVVHEIIQGQGSPETDVEYDNPCRCKSCDSEAISGTSGG